MNSISSLAGPSGSRAEAKFLARWSDVRRSLGRLLAIATLPISMGLAGCERGDQQAGPHGMPPTAVTATAAITRDVPVYLDEIGKATASETVTIQPQVSGLITKRDFEDGAHVHKNQLLFEIDPRPFQAALDQAKGQLAKDAAAKSSAEWNVKQDQAALATKAISEQQYHNDVAARDSAIGSIAVDQAMIDSAKLNLEYCSITSPIDGIAGQRLVDAGNVVTGSQLMAGTNLLVINRVDPIYADFTVTEAELQRVRHFMNEGTLQVQVQTPEDAIASAAPSATQPATQPVPGKVIASDQSVAMENHPNTTPVAFQPRIGKLIFLDNMVQDASGTVKLRAELPNVDNHFWPGQFVNVRLILTIQKDAVLIPNMATQVSQQGLFVYTVEPDDKSPTHQSAAQQMISIGQRQGDLVVVDSGLTKGQQVVTTGQMTLMPGAPVMVIQGGHS